LIYDSGIAFHALISAARNHRQEIQALLSLGQEQLEGPGRRLLAVVLAALRDRDHRSLRDRDASALLDLARSTAAEGVADRLDRSIRLAKAHVDYSVVEESGDVILRPGQPNEVRMTSAELVDRVIAGLEAVMSAHVALSCVAALIGEPLARTDLWADAGFPIEETVRAVLSLNGWTAIEVSESVDGMTVEGTTNSSSVRSALVAAAGLGPYLPESVNRVSLKYIAPDGPHVLDGSIGLLREYQAAPEGYRTDGEFLRVCRGWRVDGQPVLSTDYLRKFIAMQASGALQQEHREVVRRLKYLKRLALDLGEGSMADGLGAAISASTSRALGMMEDPAVVARLSVLSEWERRKLPNPFPESP
jgi:hypothetical protein